MEIDLEHIIKALASSPETNTITKDSQCNLFIL